MIFTPLLSPDEHQKWVEELIIPTFTQDCIPSKNPTFVLITGQSGAGKSYSSRRYAQENLNEYPVLFGTDDIRRLHPKADDIMRNDRANYTFKTKKDAGMARTKLMDYCFDKRYNIVIESILLDADDYKMKTLLQAREHGYNIECVALGVHRNTSEVSIFFRQEEQLAITKEIGFPATLGVHDDSYYLLPDILANMSRYKTVDRISIYNRKHRNFYDSNNMDNEPLLIQRKLREARNSSLNQEEMTEVALKWTDVISMMKNRNAPQKELMVVKDLFANFMRKSGLLLSSEFKKSTVFKSGVFEK
ncbi:MAG: zeta toxin family protein [Alphaproteobacteria bacterium]|nr:zeta toxin family protein [Alphaproteobacteria bacterium]